MLKNIFFLWFGFFSFANAQTNPFTFELVGYQKGIPTRELNQVGIDAHHYLCLATSKGLFRYDGYDFSLITKPGNIKNFYINSECILFEQDNQGLKKINHKTLITRDLDAPNWNDSEANNDHFANPFLDSKNRIWASDFYNAKQYISPQKWKNYKLFEGVNTNVALISFYEDSSHQLWILAGNQIFAFDEKQQKPILNIRIDSQQDFLKIHQISPHKFLLGTNFGKVYLFDSQANTIELKADLHQEIREIIDLGINKNNQKLLISCQHQLFEYDLASHLPQKIDCYNSLEPEFGNIIKDPTLNCFWIASNIGLIKAQANPKPITVVELPDDFFENKAFLNSIVEYRPNHFYLGWSNGELLDWDKLKNIFECIENPFNANINKMVLAANGDLLLATTQGILQKKKNKKTIDKIPVLKSSNISSIGFDAHQRLWILTLSQAIVVLNYPALQPQKLWQEIPMKDFWTANYFKEIVADNQGKVWLIAWFPTDFGVCFYDETKQKFQLTSALNNHNNFIGDYFIDAIFHQNYLFAAGSGGINVFDRRGKIVEKHDLSTDNENFDNHDFFKIVVDKQNFLWTGTKDGLYCFQKLGLAPIKFNEKDGLKENNTSYELLLSSQNEILVGQKNAIAVIDIQKIRKQALPNIFLTGIKVLAGRELKVSEKPILLERSENSIEISYSTLNFEINPTSIFRYRFKKGDTKWIQNAQRNKLVLVGLAPDDYALEIAVGNSRGVWNPKSLNIAFEVKPYFFETIWFKLLIVSVLILIFYLIYRYRIYQILQLEKIRTEISADLHDDVGATLSSISILSTLLKRRLPNDLKSQHYLDTILEDSLSLQNKLEEIIWSLHPDKDTVGQLGERIVRIGREVFEASGIDSVFEIDDTLGHLKLSMELRRNIILIAKEAANNLIKYAQCSQVVITLKRHNHLLLLSIKDNGKGIITNKEGNGIGNMKKRATKIKGKLEILSHKNQGTEVRLEIPITQISD